MTDLLRPLRGHLVPLLTAALVVSGTGWKAGGAEAQTPPGIVDSAAVEEVFPAVVPAESIGAPAAGLDTVPGAAPVPGAAGEAVRQARAEASGTLAERATSLVGLVSFLALAFLLSSRRRAVRWRIVAWGIGLQFVFAFLILRTRGGNALFEVLNDGVVALLNYTAAGASFIFGNLTLNNVPVGQSDGPMGLVSQEPSGWANTGAYFAFTVLPTIIFFSSLMAVLYHFGIMQLIVRGLTKLMMKTMRTSGSESLSAAGNIFLGQTEAPLLVRPFISRMTNSELHAVMTAGFASVAGGVMAAYVGMLVGFFPDIAGHLIAASVMSAPAALAISKIMVPEVEESETVGEVKVDLKSTDANVIDAAARGASEGLALALNVGAMLLAFIALLALLNGMIGWVGGLAGLQGLSIQQILGWMISPFAWLMGTPWRDAATVGMLIGEKTALNEFVAYSHLAEMLQAGSDLSPRSIVLATYALAGFANFSSIAIQIGGIGAMAPERRGDLSRLGLKAMIAGTLASFTTACVVGIIL